MINNLNLIVAYDKNRLIGNNYKLPWKISEDLEYFKKITKDSCIIMGFNTFESLKFKPLNNRVNIVISEKTVSINDELHAKNSGIIFTNRSTDVLDIIKKNSFYKIHNGELINFSVNEFFIIGGVTVYKQFIDYCSKLYITEIDYEFDGNKYFPDFDVNLFKINFQEEITLNNEISIVFKIYERL